MSERILGVDFSGANYAGDAIWVTEVASTPDGLVVADCYRGTDRWGRDRNVAYAGLVDRIRDPAVKAAGLDVPFSLPRVVLEDRCGGDWPGFLDWVAGDATPSSPAGFSESCRESAEAATGRRDVRRETDYRRGALCPYTNRVRSMTFHGARDVLRPLADDSRTAVVPMQSADCETVVCEVYPAATWGRVGGYREGYKNVPGARERRVRTLDRLLDAGVTVAAACESYVESHDALDSLAAAVAAHRAAASRPTPVGPVAEGHIYV